MSRWLVAAALLLSFAAPAEDGLGDPVAVVDPMRLGHDLELLGYASPASRGEISPASPLNGTAQTACYDSNNAAVSCEPIGLPGQDGRFGRDAAAADGVLPKTGAGDAGFDFTKLSETGDELPADAAEWACVRDNVTGLTWAADTESTHWENALTGLPGDADGALLCGLEGWRLPQIRELIGIVHFGDAAPMIDADYFPDTAGAQHWTANEAAHNTSNAWVVHFNTGFVQNVGKGVSRDARLVHGTIAANEYVDHGDGTVTSTDTGLMWSRCALGQQWNGETCDGEADDFTWAAALHAVASANSDTYLGHDDWRLPNIKELVSSFDYTQPDPVVDPEVFPNAPGNRIASSTTRAAAAFSFYQVVVQSHGQVGTQNKTTTSGERHVRLVRAGASFDDYDRMVEAGPGPEIAVAPAALEYALEESEDGETRTLSIDNIGVADLTWSLFAVSVEGCHTSGGTGWLSVSADTGVIEPEASQTIEVSVDHQGLAPGEYATTLCIYSDDIGRPRVEVPVNLTVLDDPLPEQPVIEFDPPAFSAVIFAGQTGERVLNIGNLGAHPLDWSIGFADTCEAAPPAWLVVTPDTGTVASLEQVAVTLTLDATAVAIGEYTEVLCLENNDPDQPQILIDIDLGIVEQAIDQPLNDSGRTVCYDGSHAIVPCDPPGLPGQDGRFGRDVAAEHGVLPKDGDGAAGFDFIKLGDNGEELPADAGEWACTRDNTTGLTWLADTGEADWETAMTTLPDDANGAERCGFGDWRLPAPNELIGIVHFDLFSPAVDADYFPGTPSVPHWTDADVPDNPARAFVVDFDDGGVGNTSDKTQPNAVRLVRGATVSGEYVDHGDGTVTSLDTGLTWDRCTWGQYWDGETCAGDANTMQHWSDLLLAVDAANQGEHLGYADWRLPSIKELTSITDHTRTLPAVDPEIFPNTPQFNNFIASTTSSSSASRAWGVQSTGRMITLAKGTTFKAIRLVRAGAPFDDYDRLAPGGMPVIQVNPTALDFALDFDPGGSETQPLNIANLGDAELEWSMLEPSVEGCYHPDEVSWLSLAPATGSVAPAADQAVEVTAAADGLPPGTYQTTLCVHSNDANTPRLDVAVTLVLDGDPLPEQPVIEVEPESISEVVFAGETGTRTVTIGNLGGETLDWSVGFFGAAGLMGSEVIWEQPPTGSGSIASDYFIGHPAGDVGIYAADDFLINWGQQITEIVTPGAWGSQFPGGTVTDAAAITWRIYADDGGVPAGHPEDGEDNHVWSLTLAPDDPAVTIDDEDITVDVAAAEGAGIELDAGRYWLSVVPEIGYQTSIGNRWNWRQGVPREAGGRMIDPHNLFNAGATDWSLFADVGLGWSDVAFTLRGSAVELECAPTSPGWLEVAPVSGSTAPLATDTVDITIDASALAAGDYEAVLCVESNDPEHPVRLVTVNLSVILPPTDQPLNDTGQRQCFGDDNIPMACDPEGYPGQDGRYGRDAAADDGVLTKIGGGVEGFDFTKISNSGAPLPADAQLGGGPDDWACTRDNTTGLIWAVETHAGSWDDAMATLIPDTNAAALCGFDDWRLPGAVELQSLVHYGLAQEMIDGVYFPETSQGTGATVNTYFAAEAPCQASFNRRTVDFNSGTVGCLIASASRRVQLVRGNPVEGELVVNDDHTVTDTRTQLIWDRCSLGQAWNGSTCAGTVETMTWQDALQAVAAANAAEHLGHDDWRLPNNKELPSQCDLARSNPAVDPDIFPGTASTLYWTSTTTVGTQFQKHVVDFSICRMRGNVDGSEMHRVRMVRGGNVFDAYDRLAEPPPEHPVIALDPETFTVTMGEGGALDETLTVANQGGETLEWAFDDATGCDLAADLDWLAVLAVSGDVAPGDSQAVTVSFTAGALAPGQYEAVLCIASNDPDTPLAELPASLTISGPPEPTTLEGTVAGLGYCDADPGVLAGAEVLIEGSGGNEILTTDGDGFYQTTLVVQDGPVDITVSADGHQTQTATDIGLVPGETVMQDFDLRALLGCTGAAPETVDVTLDAGEATTRPVTLHNNGLLDAGFEVDADAAWIDFTPDSGTVDAEGDTVIDVLFTAPSESGVYQTAVEIAVDDGQGPFVIEVPVTLTVTEAGAPAIGVDPDHLELTLTAGDAADHPVTLSNSGDKALDWTFGGGSYGNLVMGGDQVTISHSASLDIVESNTVACSPDGGFTTSGNRFMRVFELAGFGFQNDFEIDHITFALERLDTTAQVDVNLYTLAGGFPGGALTLVDSTTLTLEPQTAALIDAPVTASVPPGATLVVEIEPQSLAGVGQFYLGSNSAGQSAPSYTAAPACGVPEPAAIADPHVHLVMALSGHTVGGLPLECERPDEIAWLSAAPTAGTVEAGDQQAVTFSFDAGGLAADEYQALLCLVSNDPEQPVVSLPVVMTVEPAPDPGELEVTPAMLDFGTVEIGHTQTLSLEIANAAAAEAQALTLDTLTATGDDAFAIAGDCAPGTVLAPQASCTVTVSFIPDSEGLFVGAVEVIATDGQSASVALDGRGEESEPPGDEIFTDRFEPEAP